MTTPETIVLLNFADTIVSNPPVDATGNLGPIAGRTDYLIPISNGTYGIEIDVDGVPQGFFLAAGTYTRATFIDAMNAGIDAAGAVGVPPFDSTDLTYSTDADGLDGASVFTQGAFFTGKVVTLANYGAGDLIVLLGLVGTPVLTAAPSATTSPGPILWTPSTFDMPDVIAAYTGVGRRFIDGNRALIGTDAAGGNSLANRDMTFQCIFSMGDTGALPMTIYQRGLNDGTAAERTSARVRIDTIGGGLYGVWFSCVNTSDVEISPEQIGMFTTTLAEFSNSETFHLLTVTRRMEVDRSVYRAYIGDVMIGEIDTLIGGGSAGSAGGATTGTTAIGVGYEGGISEEPFDGIIDQIKITNYEMSAEEVEATYRRITEHQPTTVAAVYAFTPSGLRWHRPSTRWGKLFRVVGEVLGFVVSRVEEARENWLPDRSYTTHLSRWERMYGASPKSFDSLDTRRDRVMSLASRENGYAEPNIQEAMAEVLDLASASVEVLNFSNTVTDDFAEGIRDRFWQVAGSWTGAAFNAALSIAAISSAIWTYQAKVPQRCITALSSGRGRLVVEGKVLASTIPAGCTVGLHLLNKRSRNALWFGVKNDAGTNKIGYVSYVDDVAAAFVSIINAPALPLWFRIVRAPDTVASEDGASTTYALEYSTDGITYVSTDVANLLDDPEWAGFAAYSTAAVGGAGLAAVFDDFKLITPQGTRPFVWYVYRDPLLAGDPDMAGANQLIRSLRPAETHAAAITSLDLLCDDVADGGCDRGPCGGI